MGRSLAGRTDGSGTVMNDSCSKCKGSGLVDDFGLQLINAMMNKPIPKLCIYPCPKCLPKVFAKVSAEYADFRRQLAHLRTVIRKTIPVLEDAAKQNRECLGMVAPPVDREGIPACQPWPVIDEMIDQFREAVKTGE